MPTYNRADLLPHAIDSILNQTYRDFEFIIVNDGSTDNSAELLQSYAQKDSRIKIITHATNKGVATARQTGNDAATGKYIVVMDSDDVLFPPFLETAVSFLENNPDITILKLQGGKFNDGEDPFSTAVLLPAFAPLLLMHSEIGNLGVIFRRDFVEQHHIRYEPTFHCGEDYNFWSKMVIAGASVSVFNNGKPLYAFREFNKEKYTDCEQNDTKTRTELYNALNIPEDKRNDYCFILKAARAMLPKIFDPEQFKSAEKWFCPPPPEAELYVLHSDWKDNLVFSSDRKRVNRYIFETEYGDVLSFIPQKEITIKWDRWGTETFVYVEENIYQEKELYAKTQKNNP